MLTKVDKMRLGTTRMQSLCMRLIEFDGIPLLRNGTQGRFDFGDWEGTSDLSLSKRY
jgi:hypothetical protein